MKSRIMFAAVLLAACYFLPIAAVAQQRNTPAKAEDGWLDITAPIDPKVISSFGDVFVRVARSIASRNL